MAINYCILLSIVCTFYIENDAEILSAWKAAEKGFKMDFTMTKDAIINSCKIIPSKINNLFFPKIFVKFRCALYLYAHYTG